jgi:FAD:protein FMN transferase
VTFGEERMNGTRPRDARAADGTLRVDEPGVGGDVCRFSHEAMATVFEVHVAHPDERYASQAARAAFDLIDRLEQELSRFISNSDISRINVLPAGGSTRVSTTTLECLLVARHLFDLTAGAFDVSIGTGLPTLELDPEACVVRATEQGVRVDLGGIGKGYAVDLVAELLEEWGLRQALVHGGFSSVLALDPPPGRDAWPLTLSDPTSTSRVLVRLGARQQALSASGIRKGDHIVDPRTGVPAQGRLAAWAMLSRPAPSAGPSAAPRLAAGAVAECLSTAFMLLSDGEIEALCAGSPGLDAWVLPRPLAAGVEPAVIHLPADRR